MKKFIMLIIVLTLLFSGCSTPGTSEITAPGSEIKVPIQSDETTPSSYNLQVVTRQEGALDVYPGKDGIYYAGVTNMNAISYLDEKTGIKTALCNRPECNHSNESCNAHVDTSVYNLFMNPDKTKLFIEYSDSYVVDTEWAVTHIFVCDVNGANRKELYKTGDSDVSRDFAFSGDDLFFITKTVDRSTQTEQSNLVRLNAVSGETNIVESFDKSTKIVGGYSNYLILDMCIGSTESAQADIVKFNMDTKETELVFHYLSRTLRARRHVRGCVPCRFRA